MRPGRHNHSARPGPARLERDRPRDEVLAAKWQKIRRVRRVVTAALEIQRQDKVIGASLEAAPVVHVRDKDLLKQVKSVEFDDICITSDLQLTGDPLPSEAFRLPEVEGVGVVCAGDQESVGA